MKKGIVFCASPACAWRRRKLWHGNPRKVLDNPDIGCYECPCSGLMLFVR